MQTSSVAGPFYGLADDGRAGRIVNFTNHPIVNDGEHDRFVSTFAIAPSTGFAQVAISLLDERFLAASSQVTPHYVSINSNETGMSIGNVISVQHFNYFFGDPKAIYSAFSKAKTASGYGDVKPLYGMFGLGWEAWPFEKWHTNASSVKSSIDQFINDHGYPLSWAVIGSGFWEEGGTTTSFGRFNYNRYPDENQNTTPDVIEHLHSKGIKVMFGLRTSFPECNGSNDFSSGGDGSQGNCFSPFVEPIEHAVGTAQNYFANVANSVTHQSSSNVFPQWDKRLEILDSANTNAINWYRQQTAAWGVDGWKEDTMLTGGNGGAKVYHAGAWNPAMAALHQRGDYVMARNAYISSPGSIQRLNDTNGEQDRIPQLVLSYAASGAPNVYTDIIGNHDGDNSRYLERHAKLAALTASMSFGIEPWTKSTSANIKAAADWHEKYRPYIYSAAQKSYSSGYPFTATPLPIAYPHDAHTHDIDNSKMWQWLIDDSMMAFPLFDKSNANGHRAVYLPQGYWMDPNTHKSYQGPGMLPEYDQSGTVMPVFIGGKGVTVSKTVEGLQAEIWPIKQNAVLSVIYQYHHSEDDSVSEINLKNTGWDTEQLVVTDLTTGTELSDVSIVTERGGINFPIFPAHHYQISGGGNTVKAGGPNLQSLSSTDENIALNKSVTASSSYTLNYGAENAVDGDNFSDTSRWISELSSSEDHWIEVDLSGNFEVTGVNFWTGWKGYNTPLTNYTIDYWAQDQWLELFTASDNSQPVVAQSIDSVVMSKIRLRTPSWVKLFELEVLGHPYVNTINLALNKPVITSSNHNEQYNGSHAVDGDNSSNSSRWIAQNNTQHNSIEVDLEQLVAISKVKFWTGWNGYNSALSQYSIDYWDGLAWQPLVGIMNNSSAVIEENFNEVMASKIRLSSDEWIKLYEIEVF